MSILSSTNPTIYFDNCLVGAVVKNDHPTEMPALSALLREHQSGTLCLVASTEVLGEIERLPEQHQATHLEVWSQLRRLPASRVTRIDESATPPSVVRDPDYVKLAAILPDETDRRHVFHAVKSRVQYFATVDQQTILSRANQLEECFPIRFGKPTDIAKMLGVVTSCST